MWPLTEKIKNLVDRPVTDANQQPTESPGDLEEELAGVKPEIEGVGVGVQHTWGWGAPKGVQGQAT